MDEIRERYSFIINYLVNYNCKQMGYITDETFIERSQNEINKYIDTIPEQDWEYIRMEINEIMGAIKEELEEEGYNE